jgi:ribosomal protein S4
VTEINLEVQETNTRIDRYLSQELSDLSRSRIQKLIEEGNVQINDTVCTSKKAAVQAGDRISLAIPEAIPLGPRSRSYPPGYSLRRRFPDYYQQTCWFSRSPLRRTRSRNPRQRPFIPLSPR